MTAQFVPASHHRTLKSRPFWPVLTAEFICRRMKVCPDEAVSFVMKHTEAHSSGLIRFEPNPARRRTMTVSATPGPL